MAERLTPAEIAGEKGQLLVGQTIVEIDATTRVPTGNVFIAGAAGSQPTPLGGTAQAAVSSAPSSLTGTGAIALTYALHAGKNLHAEPGQTSLTIATANWTSDGELSVINHTGGNLPVVLGAGVNGFVNRADGDDVVGPATLIVLAYLERATIQMKGAGAFCNVAVAGGSGSFERAWATGVSYEAGEIVRATVASGAIGVGDRIACLTTHVAAASFATDVAKWSELGEDPDAVLLAGAQTISGVKTFSALPELSVAATTNNQPIRKVEHDATMALKANLASPALTGVPTVPTAVVGTNTTQVASTAFVQAEIAADLATANPLMDGVAAVGTSVKMAREDHKHPTDTTRAPLASPAFTGDVSVTDTAAGVGPVLKLENNNYAVADKGQIVFEHGSSQNAQAIIQSNLPGSNDIDLEFYTTNNAVLNATPALKLTGDNGVVLAAALPIAQGGTGSTSAAAALTALGAASSASPTFTGTATVDGTTKLGNGQDVGSPIATAANVTNVFANVESTASTTIGVNDIAMRISRSGTSGTKWGNALDVVIGSHTAGLNAQTQVDLRLNNGGVGTPDMTALTLKGNGEVLVSANPVSALGVVTKQYADALVAGLLDYRGAFTPAASSGAAGYPTTGGSGSSGAILKGDVFVASVAGFVLTEAIQIGDWVIAKVDTPSQTATNWDKLNVNVSYVPEDQASKVTSLSGASTDTQYPSAKVTFDQLALKQSRTVYTTSTDANNLVTPGAHISGSGAGQLGNGPGGAAAWEVRVAAMTTSGGTYIHQLYSTDNNDMYTRKRDNGTTWSVWTKVLNGSVAQSEVTGLTAALAAKPNIDDSSSTSTTDAWSVSKTKTYVDGKVAQTTNYQTFNDADSPAVATLDSTNQDAVGQPTLSAVGAVVTGSAFVSNIAETHASTKWIINGVVGSADAVNKTSRTIAPSDAPAGTDLGEAIPIRAAYIDSNNNQSRRAVAVNASIAEVNMASTWTDSAYPVATGSTFKFNHAQLDLFAANVKAGFFVEAKMQGGSQPTESALSFIANTLNVGVANQVDFWLGFYDGSSFTKALKIRLTNDGAGNMTVNVLEGAHWNGNVLASASWTTSGGEPAGKNPAGDQGVASSSVAAGYGLNNLTVKFQQ